MIPSYSAVMSVPHRVPVRPIVEAPHNVHSADRDRQYAEIHKAPAGNGRADKPPRPLEEAEKEGNYLKALMGMAGFLTLGATVCAMRKKSEEVSESSGYIALSDTAVPSDIIVHRDLRPRVVVAPAMTSRGMASRSLSSGLGRQVLGDRSSNRSMFPVKPIAGTRASSRPSTSAASRGFSSQRSSHVTRAQTTRNNFGDLADDLLNTANNAAAAAVARAAIENTTRNVSADVSAGNTKESFVALDREASDAGLVDEDGLPLVYSKDAIEKYWRSKPRELQGRWTEFVGLSMPFITKTTGILITSGPQGMEDNQASLARDARVIMEKLGPTYVKMGQMMSVRPDIIGQDAMDELAVLQDSVPVFDNETARKVVEDQLGCPIEDVFSEFSSEPVAAASLAQVYKATLRETGEKVAVKVQRPGVLETVSKDLYVLRRAAEVYQGLMERFAPQQNTDYVALLNEWAIGFYTELDFLNEGKNQDKFKKILVDTGVQGVYVPKVYFNYTGRQILVTEWVDGTSLKKLPPEEVRELIKIGQDAFLTQLLQVGFFHSDPHPGNLMKLDDPEKGPLCILDFGLMAKIEQEDMDAMVSAIVHLANRDFAQLVDDFINLKILPPDTNRAVVEPLMDRVLTPYVYTGGGLRNAMGSYEGGFQQITGDLLTAMNDVPFSIPPYFALLARAVAVLEGIALIGDPQYKMVMESYPFVARRLLSEDTPAFQRALNEILYSRESGSVNGAGISSRRLEVLINSAMGIVAKNNASAFVDFDTVPENGVTLGEGLKFLLSSQGKSIRSFLEDEVTTAADLLVRQSIRRSFRDVQNFAENPYPTVPIVGRFLPNPNSFLPKPRIFPVPFLVPDEGKNGDLTLVTIMPDKFVDAVAPPLAREEELYSRGLDDLATTLFGSNVASLIRDPSPESALAVLVALLQTGSLPGVDVTSVSAFLPLLRNLANRSESGSRDGETKQKEAANFSDENLQEFTQAINNLSAEERAVLEAFGANVAKRLNTRLTIRAQPLLTPA